MDLPITTETLDQIPAEFRALYSETDGGYRLKVTGLDDNDGLKSALQKERDARKQAELQVNELSKRYSGIDPDKVRELEAKAHKSEEERLLAEGKLDELVLKRTEHMQAEFDKQLQDARMKAEQAESFANQFKERALDNFIREAAAKAGVAETATQDAIYRARTLFKLDASGNPVALDADGEAIYGADGRNKLSLTEWCEGLREAAPHLFGITRGAGALGGDGGTSTNNPWLAATENMTEQGRILREDPAKAARLAKQAGKTI